MYLQLAEEKRDLCCSTYTLSTPHCLYNLKLFSLLLEAPLANREAFPGSCEQKYVPTPLKSGEDSTSCSKALFWMIPSRELARGLSCTVKCWTNSLFKRPVGSIHIRNCREDLIKTRLQPVRPVHFTADLHRQWSDQRPLKCRQTAWKMLMFETGVD